MSKILLLLCVIHIITSVSTDGMIEVFKWKQMDFYNRGDSLYKLPTTREPLTGYATAGKVVFPGRAVRHTNAFDQVITSRDHPKRIDGRNGFRDLDSNGANDTAVPASYIPYNNVPMGATHYRGRLFVTMPRRRVGIPSTLNFIDMHVDGRKESPKLHAYPDFETNQFDQNEQNIVSVYRTTVDACHRLWFIDTGMLEYPDNRQQIKLPSIWVIDLKTDKFLKRFDIPESIASTGRGLASISVDVQPDNCNATYAYIPDLVYHQLYVYHLPTDRIWAFSHNYFNFDPLAGDLNIGGQSFRWDDGIFSTALGALQPDGSRDVYFHAMASNNEFAVSNRVLQLESNAARSDHGQDFRVLGSRGDNRQSTMHEYDPLTGVIFYDEIQRDGIGCWNTRKKFSSDNHGTVVQDAQRMIYPSDLTIDNEGTIWVMSNSMPIFIYSQLDTDVYNFRVWRQSTSAAITKTKCA